MIKATYQQLVERIARLSGLGLDEINRRVEAKQAKLSGLISAEGAAQVIAAELGISFEKQKFKIIDLLIGMKKVQVTGKVLQIYPIRKYVRGGHEGELATLRIADDTSNTRVVFWDTKHITMVKDGKIKEGSVLEIKDADVRGTTIRELHLSSDASIEISSEEIKNVVTMESLPLKKLNELKSGERASVKAYVVQAFQPAFFSVCPECNMKINYENEKAVCPKHGTIMPKTRILISFIIDDGSDNMRAIAFNEAVTNLFKIQESEMEKLRESVFWLEKKKQMLGSQLALSGRVRRNVAYERDEFVVDSMQELDPEQLIKNLSK